MGNFSPKNICISACNAVISAATSIKKALGDRSEAKADACPGARTEIPPPWERRVVVASLQIKDDNEDDTGSFFWETIKSFFVFTLSSIAFVIIGTTVTIFLMLLIMKLTLFIPLFLS